MKYVIFLVCLLLGLPALRAQDTFSIVAVDPETGEVGSAGASCVTNAGAFGGVILLSGIIPGRGGVNAQAWICINPHVNLDNAIAQMEDGLSPQEVIDWLVDNDDCFSQNFDPSFRQYGIADLSEDGAARTAAFTGSNADDWKGHITGPNYSIQGNILKGPEVLDAMEANFLATEGPLAVKLMAAMQGANVVGADARCRAFGTSSTSAFLRVFRPDDEPDAPYLELNVAQAPTGMEPIDSLQVRFDEWLLTNTADVSENGIHFVFHPNPANGRAWLFSSAAERTSGSLVSLYNLQGQLLWEAPFAGEQMEVALPARGGAVTTGNRAIRADPLPRKGSQYTMNRAINIPLDLMRFQSLLRVKRDGGKRYIFDPIRKKWLALQPEELVRQLVIHYLLEEKQYNQNRINLERGFKLNALQKRYDLLVYDMEVNPFLLVECKAPRVPITNEVFEQAAWYNLELKVQYLLVTNGIESYCCGLDYDNHSYRYLEDVPDFA